VIDGFVGWIIGSIENPQVIDKILEHLERNGTAHGPSPARAPPGGCGAPFE